MARGHPSRGDCPRLGPGHSVSSFWLVAGGLVLGGLTGITGALMVLAFAFGLVCPRPVRERIVYIEVPAPTPEPRHFVIHDIDAVKMNTGPVPRTTHTWEDKTVVRHEDVRDVDEVPR